MFSVGVWHSAQPTSANILRPLAIESPLAPVTAFDGLGGARKRMNSVKRSIELIASFGFVASSSTSLLGVLPYMQPSVSSRSVGNAPLVMPISTL